jgi:cytochrome P450
MATAPGVSFWIPLPIGRRAEILHDPLNFFLRAREEHGDVYRLRLGPLLTHFVFHPDHVRHVLHERPKNYVRGWQYRLLRRLLGENLIVNDGETWLRQRKLAQPAFARERLARYAEVMVQATADALGRWEQGAAEQTVDIGAQMRRLTLDIAGRTLFSRDVSGESDVVGGSFATVAGYLKRRFDRPFVSPPTWMPTPANRRFQHAARQLNRLVLEIVRERRRDERDRGDLLSMLMAAKDDETSARLDDRQLTSTVLAFLLAGHETTATALTWTWFLLGAHPAIRERVRAEAEAVLGDRPPTFADAARLETTRRVIEESMRLYPPVWVVPRQVVADDEIGGYRIPARSLAILCPFVTHRHPAVWERPEVFDPDRFSPERSAERSKYAHFPFIAGPHQCIGSEFAMLQMRLVVAMVLREYDLELAPNQSIEPRASIAIIPNAPVRVILRRRTRHSATPNCLPAADLVRS